MRQGAKSRATSTQEKSQLSAIIQRLEAVEARVSKLESESETIRCAAAESPQSKRGRPDKIGTPELHGRRDMLIGWLEALWPRLATQLRTAKNADAVKAALTAYATEPPARYIADRADALCMFLKSVRFRRKPPKETVTRALNGDWTTLDAPKAAMSLPTRRIAAGLAGVPELKWRTSLDRCMRKPSVMAVGRAASEYFRRAYKIPWPPEIWQQAKAGNPQAQYWVGLSYAHGIGIEPDNHAAKEWFERAAKQGHDEARMASMRLSTQK